MEGAGWREGETEKDRVGDMEKVGTRWWGGEQGNAGKRKQGEGETWMSSDVTARLSTAKTVSPIWRSLLFDAGPPATSDSMRHPWI